MVKLVKRSKRKVKVVRRSKRKVTRLTGTIEWGGEPGRIVTAIIRDGGTPEPHEHDIAIRCTYENERIYEVALDRTEDGFYRGPYTATLGREKWHGVANCNLTRKSRGFTIVGRWAEQGTMLSWSAELSPIPSTPRRTGRRRHR
jgi:hypothetical protein